MKPAFLPNISSRFTLAILWNSTVALLLLAIALFFSYATARASLTEPDTCFLLATGRWIVEHWQIPAADPFSYTLVINPSAHGYVVYQWLASVLFYLLLKVGGTALLLSCVAIVLVLAFFILPAKMLERLEVDSQRSFILLLYVVLASAWHIVTRPEIFSYLFISFLMLIAVVDRAYKNNDFEINWRLVFLFGVLIIIWSNLHAGFAIGLVILFIFAITDIAKSLFYNKLKLCNTYSVSAFVSLACSLVTPYGIKLWQYLPALYFHPINRLLIEWHGLSLDDLCKPRLWGFFILSSVFIVLTVRRILRGSKGAYEYIVLGCLVIAAAIMANRSVSSSSLILATCCAVLLSPQGDTRLVDIDRTNVLRWSQWKVLLALLGTVAVATIIFTKIFSPTIPTAFKGYTPPFEALTFLEDHQPSGYLFNDPESGDVMMWNMKKPPKVFIDTRFDIYSGRIIYDYLTISNCLQHWQQLMSDYKINWVFMPKTALICQQLLKEKNWQLLYQDEQVMIFKK